MKKNKKGLSTVVTTLIIILLVLVATGIIWQVVRGLLDTGSSQIADKTTCMDLNIKAIKVINNTATNYSVTLERSATGIEDVYASIVILNDDKEASAPMEFDDVFASTQIRTQSFDAGIVDATEIRVTPYILSDGEKRFCATPTTFKFSN